MRKLTAFSFCASPFVHTRENSFYSPALSIYILLNYQFSTEHASQIEFFSVYRVFTAMAAVSYRQKNVWTAPRTWAAKIIDASTIYVPKNKLCTPRAGIKSCGFTQAIKVFCLIKSLIWNWHILPSGVCWWPEDWTSPWPTLQFSRSAW